MISPIYLYPLYVGIQELKGKPFLQISRRTGSSPHDLQDEGASLVRTAPQTAAVSEAEHVWLAESKVADVWDGYGSIPINTIFSGMNIHLPAILGFTGYQGFDTLPDVEGYICEILWIFAWYLWTAWFFFLTRLEIWLLICWSGSRMRKRLHDWNRPCAALLQVLWGLVGPIDWTHCGAVGNLQACCAKLQPPHSVQWAE